MRVAFLFFRDYLYAMNSLLNSFLYLFYPEFCLSCGAGLVSGEKVICTQCELNLPRTRFHDDHNNLVSQLFWGRIELHAATSFLFFRRKGIVQKLMHQFKYKGEKEIGFYLGKLFGQELQRSKYFNDVDCIVPIPLHPDKQKKRGYNQSEVIGQGMSQALSIPVNEEILTRTIYTDTQTKKSRFERWSNVSKVFSVDQSSGCNYNHILLVDDVVTTGATMEACAQALKQALDIKVSIATLAVAYN